MGCLPKGEHHITIVMHIYAHATCLHCFCDFPTISVLKMFKEGHKTTTNSMSKFTPFDFDKDLGANKIIGRLSAIGGCSYIT